MTLLLPQRMHLAGAVLAVAGATSGCEPELVVGKAVVKEATCVEPEPPGSGGAGSQDMELTVPWRTGFEDLGFCDFLRAGYCYGDIDSEHVIVDEPVHGGEKAAAFTITTDPAEDGNQTRCVLAGTMPRDAVYGAWFYLPALVQSTGNWNLLHFRSGPTLQSTRGIWDVSLENGPDGSLHLYVLGFDGMFRRGNPPPPVPIGEWFHIQFRLRRAADATGAISLVQDGVPLVEEMPLVTDDGAVGEFYVGNLATALMPQESTLYVDDVTVEAP